MLFSERITTHVFPHSIPLHASILYTSNSYHILYAQNDTITIMKRREGNYDILQLHLPNPLPSSPIRFSYNFKVHDVIYFVLAFEDCSKMYRISSELHVEEIYLPIHSSKLVTIYEDEENVYFGNRFAICRTKKLRLPAADSCEIFIIFGPDNWYLASLVSIHRYNNTMYLIGYYEYCSKYKIYALSEWKAFLEWKLLYETTLNEIPLKIFDKFIVFQNYYFDLNDGAEYKLSKLKKENKILYSIWFDEKLKKNEIKFFDNFAIIKNEEKFLKIKIQEIHFLEKVLQKRDFYDIYIKF